MENILLFAGTVIIYYLILFIVFYEKPVLCTPQVKRIALIALLALPINIGGNVFTIAGNAVAEKSIYSIFSFYQKAGQDAFTVMGFPYQKAGRNAVTIFGIPYQEAEQNAATFCGLAHQKASSNAITIFGLAYQQAGRDAVMVVGLAYQQAKRDADVLFGLAVYQRAENSAGVPIAIALYQRVGEKTRAFGAFSTLAKD